MKMKTTTETTKEAMQSTARLTTLEGAKTDKLSCDRSPSTSCTVL